MEWINIDINQYFLEAWGVIYIFFSVQFNGKKEYEKCKEAVHHFAAWNSLVEAIQLWFGSPIMFRLHLSFIVCLLFAPVCPQQ